MTGNFGIPSLVFWGLSVPVLVYMCPTGGLHGRGLWYSTTLPGVLGSVCTSVYISVPREVYVAGDFGIALTLPGVRGSVCTSVGICVLQGVYVAGDFGIALPSLVFGGLYQCWYNVSYRGSTWQGTLV